MRKYNILIAVLLLFGFTSCKKEFLDVKPTNSGDPATAINNVADATVLVNGLMRKMTDFTYYGRNFVLYGDAKGGDLTILTQGLGNDALYTFNHTKTSSNFSSFWEQIYNSILQANNILANIERLKAAGSTENFNPQKGQALTARALMYFDLVRLYGKPYTQDKSSFGVPNVTQVLDPYAQPLRATVEENYTQILKDLKEAEPLLPKTKTNGLPNFYANKAIQARVYLYMANYAEALSAAQAIITSNVYVLYTNAQWVDSWKTQFGSESIFELGMFPNEGDLGNTSLGAYHRRRLHGGNAILGWFMASDYFLNRLKQDPADVRWGVMSNDQTSTTRLGASYKYSGSTALAGDGKSTSTAVNIKVIRLSEIYLIAAEAAFHSDKALAANYLNQIRKRSPTLAPATAATITIDMIMEERSKELFTEGHRFFDMLRLNLPITFNDDFGSLILSPITHRTKTIDRTFYKVILPIPQDEINANPGLQAQQNPGYN